MDGLRPTGQQGFILHMLAEAGPSDTHEIAKDMTDGVVAENPRWGGVVSYDRAHSVLRRMEKRQWLYSEKEGRKRLWYITGRGMAVLNDLRAEDAEKAAQA